MERFKEHPRSKEAETDVGLDPLEVSSAPVVRCPYCHDAIPDGTLASVCTQCSTTHHVGCFAEHRGCSTHACGSTQARAVVKGKTPETPHQASCTKCDELIPLDAVVASCRRCKTLQHTGCYEEISRCARCAATNIDLMGHAEALIAGKRRQGKLLAIIGALWLSLFLTILVGGTIAGGPPPVGVAIILGLLSLPGAAFVVGSVHRFRQARALAELPPLRPGGRSSGGAADDVVDPKVKKGD